MAELEDQVVASKLEARPADFSRGMNTPLRRKSYVMFGLHVQSEFPLPISALAETPSCDPAWVFRRAPAQSGSPEPYGHVVAELRCDAPCHRGAVVVRVTRGQGGTWLWNEAVGMCHIAPGGRTVDISPRPGAEAPVLGLLLAGQVSVFMLHQLGCPTLHASAVVTERGAIAFLGPKGRGKSTMASGLLRRGATLLTDDVLPLRMMPDGVSGLPGLPLMKVWSQTAECSLGLGDELPSLMDNYDKKLLALEGRFPFASSPAPLRAFYLLDRYDPAIEGSTDVIIRRLGGRESLAALIEQVSFGAFLEPSEAALFLPFYAKLAAQAPVRVCRFPSGFAHQDKLCAAITADLE
jgi:hypothetical protein